MFICAGAFDGLELKDKQQIVGIHQDVKTSELNLNDELIKYGIIPELLGRLPIVVKMNSLSKEDLTNILKLKDFGIIAQYEKLLEVDNIKLEIDESAVLKIVDIAYKSTTGARSLKQVMEKIMLDIMFNLETNHSVKTCLISSSTIDDHRNYKLI